MEMAQKTYNDNGIKVTITRKKSGWFKIHAEYSDSSSTYTLSTEALRVMMRLESNYYKDLRRKPKQRGKQ